MHELSKKKRPKHQGIHTKKYEFFVVIKKDEKPRKTYEGLGPVFRQDIIISVSGVQIFNQDMWWRDEPRFMPEDSYENKICTKVISRYVRENLKNCIKRIISKKKEIYSLHTIPGNLTLLGTEDIVGADGEIYTSHHYEVQVHYHYYTCPIPKRKIGNN